MISWPQLSGLGRAGHRTPAMATQAAAKSSGDMNPYANHIKKWCEYVAQSHHAPEADSSCHVRGVRRCLHFNRDLFREAALIRE